MGVCTLEAIRLGKSYGDHRAVQDLSFTAGQGDIVGFVGPNGAGKTTTIRLLSTVLEPTSGQFRVAGIPGTSPIEIRRRIGVLPESAGYPGWCTGQEFLHYHSRLFGISRRRAGAHARRLLAEFGLADRADWPISSYSRGMRQRLGIARAVVNDPVVVFLDEPTLGLDPAGQRQVLAIVCSLAERREATVLLSTHALGVVEEVCTSVVILDRGRVVTAGSVAEVTRSVLPGRSARLRMPQDRVDAALVALGPLVATDGLSAEVMADRPDTLALRRADGAGGLNAALQAVIGAGVPVLSFELDGGRLSEAFLSITTTRGS